MPARLLPTRATARSTNCCHVEAPPSATGLSAAEVTTGLSRPAIPLSTEQPTCILKGEILMSHIVTIQTQIRDPAAIVLACDRLQLPAPFYGPAALFSETATGWQVQLPDWHYPVVCDVEQSQLHFDNYGGRWGTQLHLDQFLQMYAVEKAKMEARKQGYSAIEQPLADGSIKVTIEVGA